MENCLIKTPSSFGSINIDYVDNEISVTTLGIRMFLTFKKLY